MSVSTATRKSNNTNSALKSTPSKQKSNTSNNANTSTNTNLNTTQLQTTINRNNINTHNESESKEESNIDNLSLTYEKPSITDKLSVLSRRFNGFEEELNINRNKKESAIQQQFININNNIDNITNSINLETKNRAVSIDALANYFNEQLINLEKTINEPIYNKLNELNNKIDELNNKVIGIEIKHNEDRETFPKLIDARVTGYIEKFCDLQLQIDNQIKQREEKENRILIKLNEENNKLKELIIQQNNIHNQQLTQIRNEIQSESNIRNNTVDIIKNNINKDIKDIKFNLTKEITEREKSDEQIVSGLQHYAAALQDSIKIVSEH